MTQLRRRFASHAWVLLCGLAAAGCVQGPATDYGASRGPSLNGVSAFRAMLEERGHETRAAVRLNDAVAEWASVIVRFAPQPGVPEKDEADWYDFYLLDDPDVAVVYIPRDFEADLEYWRAILDQADPATDAELIDDARQRLEKAQGWANRLPPKAEKPARAEEWFATAPTKPGVATKLTGPWSSGVDAAAPKLPVHEPIKGPGAKVLLEADGAPLVLERTRSEGGRLLVVASGGFLLNEALANRARRPLAGRVADWIGPEPERVAFVEGFGPLGEFTAEPTLWGLLARLDGLRMVAIHLAALGLAAALYRAPRLGRPRPPELDWGGRPAAHAEALGALLARTGDRAAATAILAEYDRWRHDSNPIRASRHDRT